MGSTLARMFPPKFLPARDIPDLSGKIIVVTGGNAGIGYETVKQLVMKDAKVYMAGRSPDKAAAALKRLEEETNKTAIFLQLDLADLHSVRKAAETFLAQESKLDILFNNAGVMACPLADLTAQNYDLQFGTNVIGHFFFTELLIPVLTKSYEETKVPARVINTSSVGHLFAPGKGMEVASLQGGPERDAWVKKAGSIAGPWKLYGQSKMGNVFISNYFATTYSGVLVSCALHPGGIKTDLYKHTPGWQRLLTVFLFPAPCAPKFDGAYTQLWGATVAKPAQMNGEWLVPFGKVGAADKRSADTKIQEEVVAYIKEQIAGFERVREREVPK
ncbi:NAD(P)-binding protein [Mycena rosella]|uniref:NAD(P)-binding protein n=1 Tax=Mycena rosella TaxID=1033263 RepID=A0AAD7D259_MYCRO|nr:NAD(P)-binding protein [Mycena rosella]